MDTKPQPATFKSEQWTRRAALGGRAAGTLAFPVRVATARDMRADVFRLPLEQRAKAEQIHARMMAGLKYERVAVPGDKALAEWDRLRAAGRGWPVIIGGDEQLERIADQFSIGDPAVAGTTAPEIKVRSFEEILTKAAEISFPADLGKWPGAYSPKDLRAPVGRWPATVPTDEPN